VRAPRRRDLTWLSLGLVAGVIGQVILGAIVVWVDLHPAAVQGHFVLSMVLCAIAVMLIHCAGEPDGGRRRAAVLPRTRRRLNALVVWTALALLAGTVVTGTGPHAGDEKARRFEFLSISWATRVHGVVVWVAVAVAVSLLWALRTRAADRQRLDAAMVVWFCLALAQGSVGYLQYAQGVPAGWVAVHVALATLLWSATVWLRCLATTVVGAAAPTVDAHRGRSAEGDDEGEVHGASQAKTSRNADGGIDAGARVDDIIAQARRRGRRER
jgi:heme a synthase